MRLDDQFRLLEPVGLVDFQPVDETLMADTDEESSAADDADVSRYGMVRLTPLGLYGLRARLLESGLTAPAVGDLADKGANALLDGTAAFRRPLPGPRPEQWLARREPLAAARELLAAARGGDAGAPLRRLHCQQALSLVGLEAEPRCARSSTTPNWADSRGSGSPNTAPPMCPAVRGDDLLAHHRHDRRAARRRGQLRRAAGAGRGPRPATPAASSPRPGASTTRPLRTSWRRWAASTPTRRSPRSPQGRVQGTLATRRLSEPGRAEGGFPTRPRGGARSSARGASTRPPAPGRSFPVPGVASVPRPPEGGVPPSPGPGRGAPSRSRRGRPVPHPKTLGPVAESLRISWNRVR